MVYVFDDRAQRRKDNEERLREYSGLVKFETVKLIPGKSVEDCIVDMVDNPECIIFHKSYVFDDANVTFETIRRIFASFDVPVVIFSGGTEGTHKGNTESNINADLMYANLPYFLENLRDERRMNIDILLWGKRHRLNALLQFQNDISRRYFINNDLEDSIDNIAGVKRAINQSARKLCAGFADGIISDIDRHGTVTWAGLADIIEKNIQKFR